MVTASITEMRIPGSFGNGPEELQDGNMLPSLCRAAAAGACSEVCQLQFVDAEPVECAEQNVHEAISNFGVDVENFVLVKATKDRVVFADDMSRDSTVHVPQRGEVQEIPDANAFFFRPNFDFTLHHEADGILKTDEDYLKGGVNPNAVFAAGMRIADCGSLLVELLDKNGDLVLGMVHLTRTNLLPDSNYIHERNGELVSWVEKAIGDAIDHYEASSDWVKLSLLGSIASDDYVLSFSDEEKMNKLWPGWDDNGYMELVERGADEDSYKVKYTEMIVDQVQSARKRLGIRSPLLREDNFTKKTINTGDRTSGHASNHRSGKRLGLIATGRDMHIVGISRDNAGKVTLLGRIVKMQDIASEKYERADEYSASADFEDAERLRNEADALYNAADKLKTRLKEFTHQVDTP